MSRVICQTCQEAGGTSCCRVSRSGSFANMVYAPVRTYYDEEGRYHSHDPEEYTDSYVCSKGHGWTKTIRKSCWCGWVNGMPQPPLIQNKMVEVKLDKETERRKEEFRKRRNSKNA